MRASPNSATTDRPGNLRGARRKRVLMSGVICDGKGKQVQDCTLRDVSESGARIGFARTRLPLGEMFLIDVRARLAHPAKLVWHNGLEAGITFTDTIKLSGIADPSLGFLRKLWLERATR
jgi:PilZ domain-containing protein